VEVKRGYLGGALKYESRGVLAKMTVSPHSMFWRFNTRTYCNSIKASAHLDTNFRYVPLTLHEEAYMHEMGDQRILLAATESLLQGVR